MPLDALHIHMQHGHAQARSHEQTPCVNNLFGFPVSWKLQYTAAERQRNNKSGRLRWVFSSAAARRQFATSA
jgi:hypothetical protein